MPTPGEGDGRARVDGRKGARAHPWRLSGASSRLLPRRQIYKEASCARWSEYSICPCSRETSASAWDRVRLAYTRCSDVALRAVPWPVLLLPARKCALQREN